jgi:GNAT superfamily N-acetyltransferase
MTDVAIRPALFEDAGFLARKKLLTTAGISEHMWRWMGGPDCDPMLYGRARVERSDTAISWTRGWIAEHHGEPVGALLCDPLGATPTPILPDEDPAYVVMQELENLAPETATIRILAVEPGVTREGIGTSLIALADRFAGPKGLSATVSDANHVGQRLLMRHGYREQARLAMVKGTWKDDGKNWVLYIKD